MTFSFIVTYLPLEVEILLWSSGKIQQHANIMAEVAQLCYLVGSLVNPMITFRVKMDFKAPIASYFVPPLPFVEMNGIDATPAKREGKHRNPPPPTGWSFPVVVISHSPN